MMIFVLFPALFSGCALFDRTGVTCPNEAEEWNADREECVARAVQDMGTLDMFDPNVDMAPEDMGSMCQSGEVLLVLKSGEQVCLSECEDDISICQNEADCYVYGPVGEEVVICECQEGTEGDLCDVCADGYEFVPNANPEESRCFLEEEVACSPAEALRCANRDGVDCVQFADLPAQCVCRELDDCQPCAAGFESSDSNPFECVQQGVSCSPGCSDDKECVSGPQGMPVCECPEGTQDEDGECKSTCEVIFPDATSACDGHGTCMIAQGGPARGNPVCVCDDGYVGVPGAMSGPNCRECASTHVRNMDNECVLREQCNGTSTCSGAGECDDRTGFVECDCLDGYTGERCEMCESDYIRDANGACVLALLCMMATCPDNATCDVMTGMCMCDFGFVDDGMGGCQ